MAIMEAFAKEIDQEGATTRRVLERVPADRLSWKPHQKSMSLGHLALHVAQTPGIISTWALKDVFEFSGPPPEPEAKSAAQILAAHDESVKTAKDVLQKLGDEGLLREWEGKAGGNSIMKLPKVALFRAVVLNHWIHHRGQLSVYLRLLDVPVPSIYGPSADENPFGAH